MTNTTKPYKEYRDSGLPWLGDVPKHWGIRSLGSLTIAKSERSRPDLPLLSVVREKGVILRASMAAEENHNFIPDDLSNYKVARKGDLVINKMKAWQGSLGLAPTDGIVSPAYFIFKFGIEDKRYGQALLRSKPYVAMFGQVSDGVRIGQWDLSVARMKRIPILIPPLAEQSAIVRFLTAADMHIRQYVRTKQRLIKLLEEQKYAVIHRAVTRGLDTNIRLKPSGLQWLGEIPEHWEIRRAKTVCTAIIDCKNRTPDAIEDGAFTVVRTTCIREGLFDPSGGYRTDRDNFERWTTRGAPRSGDVFFTREAPAGEACLVPDRTDLCMGQRMMYFRPDPELLDPKFLLLNIYGPLTRTYIELATNGSTVGHLRLGQVYGMPILWCPVNEQRAIIKEIDEATAKLDEALASARREIALVREYRTRLIADVVTGKLDVNETAAILPDEVEDPDDLLFADEALEGADEAGQPPDELAEEEVVA
jgi:type I restriction enzyme S subunit